MILTQHESHRNGHVFSCGCVLISFTTELQYSRNYYISWIKHPSIPTPDSRSIFFGGEPFFAPCHILVVFYQLSCNWKWGPAVCSSEAIKEARLVERKVFLILDAGSGGWRRTPVRRPTPPTDNQGARALIGGGRGCVQKQHSQLWPSSWHRSSVVWPVSSWLF